MKKEETNFKNNVIRKLQRDGFTVTPAERHCGFELISTNPIGKEAGVIVRAHGHLTNPEKRKLLFHHMPIYVAHEQYTGDSFTHLIKVERVI